MPNATLTGDFGVLVIETEMIDVTSALPYPDKNWHYIDAQGHEHSMVDREYPTLRLMIDSVETYFCADCGEEHTETVSHYECLICAQRIKPGRTTDFSRRYEPGMQHATLNGEPISMERAEEIIASMRAAQ